MCQVAPQLTVRVFSFSYHASGIPADEGGHGGGFVFDCRCLPNPHRVAELRPLPGDAEPIREYMAGFPEVAEFVEHAAGIVQLAARRYAERGHTHLMVACGCTGGRHRSVYIATCIAGALHEAGYTVALTHMDRNRPAEEF